MLDKFIVAHNLNTKEIKVIPYVEYYNNFLIYEPISSSNNEVNALIICEHIKKVGINTYIEELAMNKLLSISLIYERKILMAKTNEEKLHKINEQIAHNYEKINKAKEEIKALKVQRTKLEQKIQENKLIELTDYLKKQGIVSVDDFENLFSNDLTSDDNSEVVENTNN